MLIMPIKDEKKVPVTQALIIGFIIGLFAGYMYARIIGEKFIKEIEKQDKKIEELEDLLHEEWFGSDE